MKRGIVLSLAVSSMLLVGCGQKAPEVEPVVINKNTPVKVEPSTTITNGETLGSLGNGEIPADAINGGSIDSGIDSMQSVGVDSANTYDDSVGSSSGIQPIYFAFNRYVVSDNELDKVASDARIIDSRGASSIKLEGNCDEWGTDEYNYALGLKRAKSVKEALKASGVKSSISIVSFGESKPICSEHNDACWQKNRRVDIKIY